MLNTEASGGDAAMLPGVGESPLWSALSKEPRRGAAAAAEAAEEWRWGGVKVLEGPGDTITPCGRGDPGGPSGVNLLPGGVGDRERAPANGSERGAGVGRLDGTWMFVTTADCAVFGGGTGTGSKSSSGLDEYGTEEKGAVEDAPTAAGTEPCGEDIRKSSGRARPKVLSTKSPGPRLMGTADAPKVAR